jgi:hypothetical protein
MSDPDPATQAGPGVEHRALELETEKAARAQARVGWTVWGAGDQNADRAEAMDRREEAETATPPSLTAATKQRTAD